MHHRVRCLEPWFSHIKEGRKPVEGRKNTPKYQKVSVGDTISFENELGDVFDAEVTAVRKYPNLESYLEGEGVENALPGIESIEEGIAVYLQWSTLEEIEQYGFLGIGVKPVL